MSVVTKQMDKAAEFGDFKTTAAVWKREKDQLEKKGISFRELKHNLFSIPAKGVYEISWAGCTVEIPEGMSLEEVPLSNLSYGQQLWRTAQLYRNSKA